jgi:hypothetical protein
LFSFLLSPFFHFFYLSFLCIYAAGMVLRVCRRYEEAEIMLSHALKIDPCNALARYKKAVVLVNLGKLEVSYSSNDLLVVSHILACSF